MPNDVAQPRSRLSKYWLFTYYDQSLDVLSETWDGGQSILDVFNHRFLYAVWQLECCPDTQRLHLQGYVEFRQKVRLSQLQTYMPGAHWEERRGTQAQARDYCRKEDTRISGPYEIGEFVEQERGQRNDLVTIKRKLDAGVEFHEVWKDEVHFAACCRNYRSLERYSNLTDSPRSWKTLVYVYWGPTNVGKSTHVAEVAGSDAFYASPSTRGGYSWFDLYRGQAFAVLDEFYGVVPFGFLLRLLDFLPMLVEWKGSSRQWKPRVVFITSNKSPLDWYVDPKLHVESLYRRLTRVYYVSAFDCVTEDPDFPRGPDEEKEA